MLLLILQVDSLTSL